MAYNFWAEKHGEEVVQEIQEAVAGSRFVEVFPISFEKEITELGISVPMKAASEPGFELEFDRVMRFFMVEKGFSIVDLYTGLVVDKSELPVLAKRIVQ
jgi:hypothetical protein